MSNLREIGIGLPWGTWICELVERCNRCNLKRTRHNAAAPSNVKVDHIQEAK